MKKGRLMALALAVAITTMGAGYAAWTDSVTIQSTVNTGKLELGIGEVTTTYKDNRSDATANGNILELKSGNTVVSTFTKAVNADSAVLTINNMYPGVESTAKIRITNTSTIPVKFDMSQTGTIISIPNNINDPDLIVEGKLDFSTLPDITTVTSLSAIKTALESIVLPVGETIDVGLNIKLKDSDTNFENQNFEIKFVPKFKQFNQ